jgi:sulfur carrier protein
MSTATATLQIYVNDKPRALAGAATLLDLLRELGFAERKGVAVAVNGAVVSRRAWPAHVLGEGDRLLVIQATQGG